MHMIEDSGFLIFMLALIVIGLPVIGGLLHATYKIRLTHREKMATMLNAQAAEKAAQYAAQSERLEQRVRVLERIVTDRGMDVSDSIERLRDDRTEGGQPALARPEVAA